MRVFCFIDVVMTVIVMVMMCAGFILNFILFPTASLIPRHFYFSMLVLVVVVPAMAVIVPVPAMAVVMSVPSMAVVMPMAMVMTSMIVIVSP